MDPSGCHTGPLRALDFVDSIEGTSVTSLHPLLVFLHVLSVSAWIGAALWVASDVRRTVALGHPHVDVLGARVRPALGLDAAAGIATIVTGGLLLWETGMAHPRPGISAGIVLALLRLAVLAVMRRTWRDLFADIRSGETVTGAHPGARRMSKLSGIAHVLWLLALAGMVFPI